MLSPPALGQLLPTLCMHPPAAICRRNRRTGRCGRRKAVHPAAPSSQAGQGLLLPRSPSWAQHSELQEKSSRLLPASAPSTALAPGAALHNQYCSHPNIWVSHPECLSHRGPGLHPRTDTECCREPRRSEMSSAPRLACRKEIPQHLVYHIYMQAERATAACIFYMVCPGSQAGMVFPPSVGLEM